MPRDGTQLIQTEIAQAVARRSYRKGWTPEQFIARQVCKLAEEVGEVAGLVQVPDRINELISNMGQIAGAIFRRTDYWDSPDA